MADRVSSLPRAKLASVEPQLFVADIVASCDFFSEKLGFTVGFKYGEPPFYAQVQRDGLALNLRCVVPPVLDAARCARDNLLAATFTVASADALRNLFAEYQAAGATFHQDVRREAWGSWTFVVRDPDGNRLLFAGPGD